MTTTEAPAPDEGLAERYLDLLERTLTGYGVGDPPLDERVLDPDGRREGMLGFLPELRDEGLDWPSTALTMIGRRRLRNLRELIEQALGEGVPGDVLEAGVWRGGACILARAVLDVRGGLERRVFVADSFAGLPAPSPEHPADRGARYHLERSLSVSQDEVRASFERFGLLSDRVVFVPGWFRDSLPTLDVDALAVLRLDGDMYGSTMDPLVHLYDRVSPGGFVIVDDYQLLPCCRQAVTDFFDDRGLAPELHPIDRVGVWFRKP